MTKKRKITWASSVATDSLQPFVREILGHIAEITEQPGVAGAMVSDESWISDFLPMSCKDVEASKQRIREAIAVETDPEKRAKRERMLAVFERPGPSQGVVEERLRELSSELGIEIDLRDCVYEVAIRLRDK